MTGTSPIRGIEHVGITVPDLDKATRFFEQAFDAEFLYELMVGPVGGDWLEAAVGVPPGTELMHIRMMRLANGPNLELFVYRSEVQRPPVLPSDFGLQHFAICVDDIDAVAARILAAGGTLLAGPLDLPGGDAGPGNRFMYTRTPWGSTMELVTFKSPLAYEASTRKRRWRPS
jgi:catechol 2,3-dioxygenase-like lactoylglutathione lyase family enzyme